jgi:hypothetical protein
MTVTILTAATGPRSELASIRRDPARPFDLVIEIENEPGREPAKHARGITHVVVSGEREVAVVEVKSQLVLPTGRRRTNRVGTTAAANERSPAPTSTSTHRFAGTAMCQHRPLGRSNETGGRLQERRLSGAGRPHDRGKCPASEDKAERVERRHLAAIRAVDHRDGFELDRGVLGGRR